jgi:hypothetical protein
MSELKQFQATFFAGVNGAAIPATAMTVYSNTILLGAIDALRENYPVTCEIVGLGEFETTALAFARQHPPESPVLATYGRNFPGWLSTQQIGHRLTYLADVARCERMWLEALHAADAPVVKLADLQARAPEALSEARLKLHPATKLAWHATPAIEIWLAHQGEGFDELAPIWRPCGALFTRPDLSVRAAPLDAAGHRLLHGLRLGESIGAATTATSLLYPAANVVDCFVELVGNGAFTTTH